MNFIGEWFLDNINVCDDIIDYFKSSNDIKSGRCTSTWEDIPQDTSIKKCSEILIDPLSNEDVFGKYIAELQKVVLKYIEKYPYSNAYSGWGITERYQIQHYKPGEAFYAFHTERGSADSTRHLAWMTYLNDVNDCGETEFYHQQIKVKPEKGKTLIWPTDWTHTHRGITSPTEEKYIVTGWFNYIPHK